MNKTKGFLIWILLITALLSFNACDDTSDSLKSGDSTIINSQLSDSHDNTDLSGPYEYTHTRGLRITSLYSGTITKIAGNVFVPIKKIEGQKFPAIIFINSWSMDENEYLKQAEKFAAKGYIVLSYSCRGWGDSGGRIEMGAKEDWADFSSVVDWLEDNTPIDISNLGVSGISLGGGGSLHAVSHDPRVKTVAALSSYIDAAQSMFSDDTPRLVWGFMLVASGTVTGEMHQEIYDVYTNTLINKNIDWLRQWAGQRSPMTYVNDLNALNKPVYMGHNFGDHLFRPDIAIDYFNKLTVDHKRLDMNQGTHGTGEAFGVLGLPNYTYNNVHKWFDYWLKGIDTGIIAKDKNKTAVITMEVKHSDNRVVYNTEDLKKNDSEFTWPSNNSEEKRYFLHPRNLISQGKLKDDPVFWSSYNKFYSGILSGATSGIPMISQVFEQFDIPVFTNVNLISKTKAIVYKTGTFFSTQKLRGTPEININLSLSGKKGQVFFYLYDVDVFGTAKYITMGFKTFWNATPGEIQRIKVRMISAAYDLKAGHKLALVMDTHNPEYGTPTFLPFSVKVHYSKNDPSVLTVTKEK